MEYDKLQRARSAASVDQFSNEVMICIYGTLTQKLVDRRGEASSSGTTFVIQGIDQGDGEMTCITWDDAVIQKLLDDQGASPLRCIST